MTDSPLAMTLYRRFLEFGSSPTPHLPFKGLIWVFDGWGVHFLGQLGLILGLNHKKLAQGPNSR